MANKNNKLPPTLENMSTPSTSQERASAQVQSLNETFDENHSIPSSASELQLSTLENKLETQMTKMATMIQTTVKALTEHMEKKLSEFDRRLNHLSADIIVPNTQNLNLNSSQVETNQSNMASNSELLNPVTCHSQSRGDNSNMKIKPQTYSGSSDFEEFLSQFEITCEINSWQYREKSLYLANCLTGEARSLLNELDNEGRRDYKTLVEKLTNRFGSINRSEIYRTQLKSRVKNKGETIPELAQAIKKLVRQAYPGVNKDVIETLSLDNFIDALTDSDIRMRLRELGPKSLAEAEQIAVRMEAHKIADKQRSRLVGRLDTDDQITENKDNTQNQLQVLCDKVNSLTNQMKSLTKQHFQNKNNDKWLHTKPTENYHQNNQNYARNHRYNRQSYGNHAYQSVSGQQGNAGPFRGNNSQQTNINRNHNSFQNWQGQNRQNSTSHNNPNSNFSYSTRNGQPGRQSGNNQGNLNLSV